MNDLLTPILHNKKAEIACEKKQVSQQSLLRLLSHEPLQPCRSLKKAVRESTTGIIAEFKRKSPSKGWIQADAKPGIIIPAYQKNGAAACSILTDREYFGGSRQDFMEARKLTGLPLLRKEFIIDEYQVYQSKIIGADAILLIAAILTPESCRRLATLAKSLHMEVLLEIHEFRELEYLSPEIDLLGVNNRCLGTFQTDIEQSVQFSEKIQTYLDKYPSRHTNPVLVAESGISAPWQIHRLKTMGFEGFLIGEAFMKTASPGKALGEFLEELETIKPYEEPTAH